MPGKGAGADVIKREQLSERLSGVVGGMDFVDSATVAQAQLRTESDDAWVEVEKDSSGRYRPQAQSISSLLYDPRSDPKRARWILDPHNPRILAWDQLVGLLLVFTALVTPYEVAFLPTRFGALFVANRAVDLAFLSDLVMNFFLAYYDLNRRQWVCSHRRIALRYLSSWFFLDLASILPFDSITLAMESSSTTTTTTGSGSRYSNLRVLRVVRLLRLLKLLRIVRASRIWKRWENRVALSFSAMALVRFLVGVLVISHWIACLLRLFVDIEVAGGERAHVSWMTEYTLQPGCAAANAKGVGGCPIASASAAEQYIAALYWSVMTLTTIGYGDVVAKTHGERALVIVCMLLGAGV